jgi:LysR family transcriptional regulator, carnitine catabolism transcriptional activator
MRTRLSLRQLEAIVGIADRGSFSAAAEQLHVSQPALSRTVRLAEESLGTRVFDRDTRRVSLTPAGTELLAIARRVLLEFEDSMGELVQFMEGRRGRIRVSAVPSMAQSLLVDAVARFALAHPEVDFLLGVEPADQVLAKLEAREIEVGLTVQPPPDGRFSYRHLHDEELVLICRSDDPLAVASPRGAPLDWKVFETRRFIAATPGSHTRGATDAAFMQAGITVRPTHEVASSNLPFIGALVAAGLGLSVLPEGTLTRLNQPGLVARRLRKPHVTRKVGIVALAGRTLSVAAMRFCEHLAAHESASAPAPARHGKPRANRR